MDRPSKKQRTSSAHPADEASSAHPAAAASAVTKTPQTEFTILHPRQKWMRDMRKGVNGYRVATSLLMKRGLYAPLINKIYQFILIRKMEVSCMGNRYTLRVGYMDQLFGRRLVDRIVESMKTEYGHSADLIYLAWSVNPPPEQGKFLPIPVKNLVSLLDTRNSSWARRDKKIPVQWTIGMGVWITMNGWHHLRLAKTKKFSGPLRESFYQMMIVMAQSIKIHHDNSSHWPPLWFAFSRFVRFAVDEAKEKSKGVPFHQNKPVHSSSLCQEQMLLCMMRVLIIQKLYPQVFEDSKSIQEHMKYITSSDLRHPILKCSEALIEACPIASFDEAPISSKKRITLNYAQAVAYDVIKFVS